jgi:hypothetical protein
LTVAVILLPAILAFSRRPLFRLLGAGGAGERVAALFQDEKSGVRVPGRSVRADDGIGAGPLARHIGSGGGNRECQQEQNAGQKFHVGSFPRFTLPHVGGGCASAGADFCARL